MRYRSRADGPMFQHYWWFQSMNWQHRTKGARVSNHLLRWDDHRGWYKLPGAGWRVRTLKLGQMPKPYRTLYGAKMAAEYWR